MNVRAERKNFIKCMNSTTHRTTVSNSFSFDLVVTSSIYPVIKTQHGQSQNIFLVVVPFFQKQAHKNIFFIEQNEFENTINQF